MTDERGRPAFDWRTYWEELKQIARRHPDASEDVLDLLEEIAASRRPAELEPVKAELQELSDEDLVLILRTLRSARKDMETRPGLELVADAVGRLEDYAQRRARTRGLVD